ncbi:MAG: GTP-binding protein [Pirellula sp.]
MLKSRYLMIGGFLGAGNTTAILQLAKKLRDQGTSVGLITNDQSIGLVDTQMLRQHGFETEEITGGCFCCRFNSLLQASENLSAETRPSVFVAEPVGSCTDLRATVSYPLQKIYGDRFAIAPLSVVLDPNRTRRIFGLESGKTFSPKVVYIFKKQIEEADILVINKCDIMQPDALDALQVELEREFPGKTIVRISARTGEGLDAWLAMLLDHEGKMVETMEVDYDEYAEGEALLGWLNVSAQLSGSEFDGNRFLLDLAGRVRSELEAQEIEIAHFKMTLSPNTGEDLAVGNLVRTAGELELSHELAEPLEEGELFVNLRAEGAPDALRSTIQSVLTDYAKSRGLQIIWGHVEAFRPGRPVPTHRVTVGAGHS